MIQVRISSTHFLAANIESFIHVLTMDCHCFVNKTVHSYTRPVIKRSRNLAINVEFPSFKEFPKRFVNDSHIILKHRIAQIIYRYFSQQVSSARPCISANRIQVFGSTISRDHILNNSLTQQRSIKFP